MLRRSSSCSKSLGIDARDCERNLQSLRGLVSGLEEIPGARHFAAAACLAEVVSKCDVSKVVTYLHIHAKLQLDLGLGLDLDGADASGLLERHAPGIASFSRIEHNTKRHIT